MAQDFSQRPMRGYAPRQDTHVNAPRAGSVHGPSGAVDPRAPQSAYDQGPYAPDAHGYAQEDHGYGYTAAEYAAAHAPTERYGTEQYATDQNGSGAPAAPHLGKTQLVGAAVSMALIVGLGVWGYRLMVRDVSGVPVIRAMSDTARMVPDDPGGQLAMHQGLAVNSVTADGSAKPPADRLVLAPRAIGLTDEDQPMEEAALTALTADRAPSISEPTPEVQNVYAPNNFYTQTVDADPEPAAVSSEVASGALPVAADVADDIAALAQSGDASVAQVGAEDAAEVAAVEVSVADTSGLRSSPRPKPRPIRLASAGAAVAADTGTMQSDASLNGVAGDILAALGTGGTPAGEMDPADVPVGARLVQFGAYQNADIARSEWDRLMGSFEDYMAGKTRVIERAQSGGKTFYRLRAFGFADAADSNRFCAALTSMNAACVPVRQR